MRIKTLILAACVLCSVAFAEQRVISIPCRNGEAQTGQLEQMLKDGWRVVTATAVTDSDSVAFGKPKQAYTASIVYVVEKN